MLSRPMRARGLKRVERPDGHHLRAVAPHAGAWIETPGSLTENGLIPVAPHADAWSETQAVGRKTDTPP